MRITQDNTNLKLYISIDGIHWSVVVSTAKNDFIIPNKVGFGINPYDVVPMQALFVHWSLTYS
jgi:hypothetical protein